LTNRYGFKFEIGKSYKVDGIVKFGIDGNGFHMCERLEDTLRYFDAMKLDVSICEVVGNGKIVSFSDDYNEYYDMYSVEEISIIKKLDREEIILMMLNANETRVFRFLQLYRLNDWEVKLFQDKFKNNINILNVIDYYQYGIKDIYSKKYIK
jgi:hypothetical protein